MMKLLGSLLINKRERWADGQCLELINVCVGWASFLRTQKRPEIVEQTPQSGLIVWSNKRCKINIRWQPNGKAGFVSHLRNPQYDVFALMDPQLADHH